MHRFPSLLRRVRAGLTVPNVLATVAVLTALTGSSYAAVLYSGKHVKSGTLTGTHFKNSTITGAKIKNRALQASAFSSMTVSKLRVRGPVGDQGPQGLQGEQGRKGATGDKGKPAPRAFTFQTSAQSTRIKGSAPNPSAYEVWSPNMCADSAAVGDLVIGCNPDGSGTPVRYPRWSFWCSAMNSKRCNVNNISVPQLTRSEQSLILTAENSSGGQLNMPYNGTIVLNASLTFYTQMTSFMQRAECQLQVRRVENGNLGAPINVGEPMTVARRVSSDRNEQQLLVNLALTGATAQAAGVFETQVACRAPDDNGSQADRIEFIEGNMSVLSTRTNGQA